MRMTTYPSTNMPIPLRRDMHIARGEAFAIRRGWPLGLTADGQEIDQFDSQPSCRYIVCEHSLLGTMSTRLLSLDDSMVVELWPDGLAHLSTGWVEVSRTVAHVGAMPSISRRFKDPFLAELRREEPDAVGVFAVADRSMLAVYRRVIRWQPDEVLALGDYFLCKWTTF